MYVAKRSPKIREEMQLGEDGPILLVELDTDKVAQEFEMRRAAVVQAQFRVQNLKKENPDNTIPEGMLAEYGKAIMEWFEYIFGVEQAKMINEYYEGKPIEMIDEVFPFITGIIMPQIQRQFEHMKERNKQAYKGKTNRAWRRKKH
jgi:hypothetical protein